MIKINPSVGAAKALKTFPQAAAHRSGAFGIAFLEHC